LQESSIGDPYLNHCLKLLFFVLLAISESGFGQQDQDSKLASLLATAQRAQTGNDYAAAAAAYKQAVTIRPELAELWANLGLMEHEAGDYNASIKSLLEANRLKPSLYVPNLFLGVDYLQVGKAKNAVPFLMKAEKLNSADAQSPLALGRAYASLGEHVLAAREFTRALHIDPRQSVAWFALGIAYLDMVEEGGRRMTTEYPNSTYAKALFAESLAKQGRYKEANDLYESIIDRKPQPPCMRSELGWAYLKQHESADADKEFKQELLMNPGCSLALAGQARLLIDAGSNDQALGLIVELWNRDQGFAVAAVSSLFEDLAPGHSSSFLNHVSRQHDSGTVSDDLFVALTSVLRGAQPSEQVAPSGMAIKREAVTAGVSPATAGTVAEVLYTSGRYESCAARLQNSLLSKNIDNLLLLSTCSFFTGDYELTSKASAALMSASSSLPSALYWSIKANERLASRSLEQFEVLEPNSATSHILSGDIWRQRKQYEEAETEYKKALELSPNDHAALLGLATAYYGDGNISKSVETTQAALLESPEDPELNLLMGEGMVSKFKFAEAEPFLDKSLSVKPQMLSHVHALLGEVYAKTGRTQDAITQLKMGLESDEDGSLYYQLSMAYRTIGDAKDAAATIEQMKVLRLESRKRAASSIQSPSGSTLSDGP
jgi:tetratricopeptide (TPR) repeat protein